jgi:hypothetical protein
MKFYLCLFTGLNFCLILFLTFHEKILNLIDTITMPINEELCKRNSLQLVDMSQLNSNNLTLKLIESQLSHLNLAHGGKNVPSKLKSTNGILYNNKVDLSKTKVAIIIPYRNRKRNLGIFLYYMHLFLSRQSIYYGIYLIEPLDNLKFNRALLLNIGFVEALKEYNWNCFIFHDVVIFKYSWLIKYQLEKFEMSNTQNDNFDETSCLKT